MKMMMLLLAVVMSSVLSTQGKSYIIHTYMCICVCTCQFADPA